MDRKRWVAAVILAFACACSGSPGMNDPDGDSPMDAYMPPTDGFVPMPDAGPPGCTVDAQCDDGVDCTVDACVTASGNCRHVVTPALCAAGESCNPAMGCEMGRACATDADCADTDACTTMERCDPAARVCTFVPLDGDGDGDPPRVCGGGDCDDSNAAISSGADERCNGIDDNCDAMIDEGFNLTTDAANCGSCGNACTASGSSCVAGACRCSGTLAICGSACVDLTSDAANCGACRRMCPAGTTCSTGECRCPDGDMLCGSMCFDTSSDPAHCGDCSTTCDGGRTCAAGLCRCPSGQTLCTGSCHDLATDEYNCGTCGRGCRPPPGGGSVACRSGACISCGELGLACCDDPSPCGSSGLLTCDASAPGGPTCVSTGCGSPGQPCCTGDRCASDSACFTGMCARCGGPGETCCPGSSCRSGNVCLGGTCRADRDCTSSECDLLVGGCPSGQACYVTYDGTSLSVECRATGTGTGTDGSPCTNILDCAPGYDCNPFDNRCREFCCDGDASTCPSGQSCIPYADGSGGVTGIGACSPPSP